jgi:hypothetical protein
MKINTRTSIKQLAGVDAACQVHVVTRCSLSARMLKSAGSSVTVYMEIFSGPWVIRIPGWSTQFWTNYSPIFPTEIITVYYYYYYYYIQARIIFLL